MSRRFHNFNNRKQFHNKKNSFSIKWSIIWVIIHFASLFLLIFGIQRLNLNNSLIILLLTGFGVTIISRVVRIFTIKRKFVVDIWFLFWSILNSATIWIFFILLNALNIGNYFVTLLLTALGLVVVAYFVRKIRITKTILWVSVIIILLLLFFTQNSNQENIVYSSFQNTGVSTGNIFDSIKNILPATISKECPQINFPLKDGIAPFIDIREYDSWKIDSYDSTFNIHCYRGNKEGQKTNYWYCGEGTSIEFPIAFMQKTMINSDGSIGKTIKQSFYNIYDENKKFVKTVCGEDPDKIVEKEWKEMKDSIRGIWD